MFEKLNGSEIVATLAEDRPYWRLGAVDLGRWIGTLPPSAIQDNVARIDWIGEGWDGCSDVRIGEASWGTTYRAGEITKLLAQLSSGLQALAIDRIVPPEPSNVRICRIASNSALVIDFDFVDFILPLAMNGAQWIGKPAPSSSVVADQMLQFLKGADAMRHRVARREAGLRRALDETAASIGHGASPLWLRMRHVPYYDNAKHLLDIGYVVLLATINDKLLWAPTGSERIHTVREVRAHRGYYASEQRKREAMLTNLLQTDSAGWVSRAALAAIAYRGLDVRETFDRARSAAMADRGGGIHFEEGKIKESLSLQGGVLDLSMSFPGGHYHSNSLLLLGTYPASVAVQAKGKLICEFVDHAALAGRNLKVIKVDAREGSLTLYHAAQNIPIEQAVHEATELRRAA